MVLWCCVAAAVVLALNVVHALQHSALIPSLIFIGVTLFLLLRWTQVILAKDANQRFYRRWWAALATAVICTLADEMESVLFQS